MNHANKGNEGNEANQLREFSVSSHIAWDRWLPAPAKLNLFLHVTGRRADGYHTLQTVFRLIDLADCLRFSPRADDEVHLATPLPGVSDEDELSVRAAQSLQARAGCERVVKRTGTRGVTISVHKRIPIGGGLGGGSSDAATTLMALNRLWDLHLDHAALAAIGARLGADVPFFLFGQNAFAEGIGERLTAITLPPAWYVILIPPVGVSTRDIFSAPELTRNSKDTTITAFFASRNSEHRNDLEEVVRKRYPLVAASLEWLGRFGPSRMSGSGSSVFCEFQTEPEAQAVIARLEQRARLPDELDGVVGVIAEGLQHHPLAATRQSWSVKT